MLTQWLSTFNPFSFLFLNFLHPGEFPQKIVKFCGAFLKHKLPLLSLSLKWKALAFGSEFSAIHSRTITLCCFWSQPPMQCWVLKPRWPLSVLCRFSCLLFPLRALPFCSGIVQDAMFCLMLFQLTSRVWRPCLSFPLLPSFVATDDFRERERDVPLSETECFVLQRFRESQAYSLLKVAG